MIFAIPSSTSGRVTKWMAFHGLIKAGIDLTNYRLIFWFVTNRAVLITNSKNVSAESFLMPSWIVTIISVIHADVGIDNLMIYYCYSNLISTFDIFKSDKFESILFVIFNNLQSLLIIIC